MKHSLQLRLSQHLTLTPQLQQSIRLLPLSTLELTQELERVLQENPLLERDDGIRDQALAPPPGTTPAAPDTAPAPEAPAAEAGAGDGESESVDFSAVDEAPPAGYRDENDE